MATTLKPTFACCTQTFLTCVLFPLPTQSNLISVFAKMSPLEDNVWFAHNTQISGSGYVAFTRPHSDAFNIHACQQMPTAKYRQWNDIAIECHLDIHTPFRMWEDLPDPSSFIRFTGELTNCKRKIVGGNVLTSCLSVLLN